MTLPPPRSDGTRRNALARRDSAARIWAWPVALAVLSTAGLIAALVGDDVYDVMSWLALGVPVAVTAWFVARRQRAARR